VPRFRSLATAAGAALALTVAPATAASAHEGGTTNPDRAAKRQQFLAGTSVPVLSSPNVRFVTNVPDTALISGVFAKTAPLFIASSLDSITVYDVSDPLKPTIKGVLPIANFENEAMNYGEKKEDGVLQRFVLVGYDLVGVPAGTNPSHTGTSNEVAVVDVTDPTKPYVRSTVRTTTNTHTVACIRETDCQYAYTAGSRGKTSVIDLSDLDAPREATVFTSPAAKPNAAFPSGSGHKWNFDQAGYGLHTGSGGTAVFDVSDPVNPLAVQGTNAAGTESPWNDFIHHNSDRPNASRFTAGAAASVANGNVLLVTEEDYENTDCATAGSFQTWYVPDLDGAAYRAGNPALDADKGTIRPLDRINPVTEAGGGLSLPTGAFCSAHWFDMHQSGIVAQGYYQAGMRLIDVRDAANLTQYGWFTSGVSEVWDAYYVPERNSKGIATGKRTNVVYVADAVRGLDVLTVDLPGATTAGATVLSGGVGNGGTGTGPIELTTLVALLLATSGAAVVRRRVAVRVR
jgi:hypothetical protein